MMKVVLRLAYSREVRVPRRNLEATQAWNYAPRLQSFSPRPSATRFRSFDPLLASAKPPRRSSSSIFPAAPLNGKKDLKAPIPKPHTLHRYTFGCCFIYYTAHYFLPYYIIYPPKDGTEPRLSSWVRMTRSRRCFWGPWVRVWSFL